jgi:hypothetical protein
LRLKKVVIFAYQGAGVEKSMRFTLSGLSKITAKRGWRNWQTLKI